MQRAGGGALAEVATGGGALAEYYSRFGEMEDGEKSRGGDARTWWVPTSTASYRQCLATEKVLCCLYQAMDLIGRRKKVVTAEDYAVTRHRIEFGIDKSVETIDSG